MPRIAVEDNSRMSLRIRAEEKALLLRAVALDHTDLTDFVLRHALLAAKAVIEEADGAREAGEPRVILFGLCGHGNFDLSAYDEYLAGRLEDPEFSQADLDAALADLPEAPALA